MKSCCQSASPRAAGDSRRSRFSGRRGAGNIPRGSLEAPVRRRRTFFWTAIVATVLASLVQISHGMDLVRVESQTDAAVARYGVTGRGVTVAVLDRGIDWRNPDFIKGGGTTRIKWMLDMSGQNLCNPSNPSPVEFTETQINAALSGGPPINERDAVGHGTATAGVAA